MSNKFEKEIDDLVISGEDKILPKLEKLAKQNNNDHYILLRIAMYKYENSIPGYKEDFISLLKDNEYLVIVNYYLGLIYLNEENSDEASKHFNESIKHYDDLEAANKNDENTHYYAARSFLELGDYQRSTEAIEKAIILNKEDEKYLDFIKKLPYENNVMPYTLELIKRLIQLNTSYTRDLRLLVPQLMYKLRHAKEALMLIKNFEDHNITSPDLTLLKFRIYSKINDDKQAESIINTIDDPKKIPDDTYKLLFKMYNKEALFDKSFEIIENIEDHKVIAYKYILYYRASTLMHIKDYEQAEYLLTEAIDGILDSGDNEPNISQFYRLRALCFYLNGDYDQAADEILSLNYNNGHKIEILLRNKLELPQGVVDSEDQVYSELLDNYDQTRVYQFIKGLFNSKKSLCGVTERVNLGKFLVQINEQIKPLKPAYTMNTDTYLINCGKPMGFVDEIETQFFIVEAIPGGGIFNLRPVIPTVQGAQNFHSVRIRGCYNK